MDEVVFPPCPNWFLPSVLSCIGEGTLVYGSRNNIVVCRHKPDISLHDNVSLSLISCAHKERVTRVLLSPASVGGPGHFPCTIASAAEDSVIKLWDLQSHTLILEQTVHLAQGLVGLDWSRADPDLIVSVDKHSLLVVWNLHSNTVHKLTFKLNPTCLACSPHLSHIVAVGSHSGLVTVISTKGKGQVMHRMRGHDEEVCALAWCPVDYNVLSPGRYKEHLLASGCKGRQVYLWRTLTDGREQLHTTLQPHPFSSNSRYSGTSSTSSFYMCLVWPEPTTLVTNALFGEVLAWDLSGVEETAADTHSKGKKSGWPRYVRMLHDLHTRAAYTVSCPPYVELPAGDSSEGAGLEGKEAASEGVSSQRRLVWSLSQDRYLVACCLRTGNILVKLPTFSSAVYSITASPLDPSKVGIGVGDAAVRVWNLNNTEEFEVSCFWQRIKSKVLVLAWHPLKENVLAFATGEGRIGLLTVTSGKPPVIFKMQHRDAVYSMCWGPYCYPQGDVPGKIPEVALYTCGSGDVFQFDPMAPEEYSKYPMEKLKQVSVDKKVFHGSELLWKSDNTIFAVGLTDGSIHMFSSPHLELLHSLYSVKKYIQMFAWHPESTVTDAGFSPYCNWLAVAANEKTVRVFNFTPVVESLPADGGVAASVVVECCSVLSGHEDKVPCLCWNPHISGQLVTVSYDGTAQVWDVPSQTALVVFSGHEGSVFSCLWSPVEPDVILTGGTDATVYAWHVSNQTYKPVHQLVSQRKRALKVMKRSNEISEKQVQQLQEQDDVEAVVQPACTSEVAPAEVAVSKRVKQKSLLSSVKNVSDDKLETYLDACRTLLDHSGEEAIPCSQHEDHFPLFALYSDRESVCRLLDKEGSAAKESPSNAESMQYFELWKGNIAELLKTAAREKKLSTLLVSLAPLASPRLWLEMCKAYADQLAESGHVQKAASYLVACHRLEEAIALLADRDRFTDALVLAKCRGADPSIVTGILTMWAHRLANCGNLELAAERLLVVGDLDKACQMYARSKHMASHRFAAVVALKAGLADKATSLAREALLEHLAADKWQVACSIIQEHPQLQPLAVLVDVHRGMVERAGSTSGLWEWLGSDEAASAPGSSRYSWLRELEACAARHKVSREQLQQALSSCHFTNQEQASMWLEVSKGLCLAWTAYKEAHCDQSLRHLVKVMDAVYQARLLYHPQHHSHLLLLCSWLAPSGPCAECSVFNSASLTPGCSSLVQSLRAYLCAAIVFWLEGFQQGEARSNGVGEQVSDELACNSARDCGHQDGQGPDTNWGRVCIILRELLDDVVNAEAVGYFKIELKIKKLAASVASAVVTGTTPSWPWGKQPHIICSDVNVSKTSGENAGILTEECKAIAIADMNKNTAVSEVISKVEKQIAALEETSQEIKENVKVTSNRSENTEGKGKILTGENPFLAPIDMCEKTGINGVNLKVEIQVMNSVDRSEKTEGNGGNMSVAPAGRSEITGLNGLVSVGNSNVAPGGKSEKSEENERILTSENTEGKGKILTGENPFLAPIDMCEKTGINGVNLKVEIQVMNSVDRSEKTEGNGGNMSVAPAGRSEITGLNGLVSVGNSNVAPGGKSEKSEENERILTEEGVTFRNVAEGQKPLITEQVVQSERNEALDELEQLKKSKETFEAARVSVPNPYFLWFKVQNISQALLLKHEPQLAECLLSHLAKLRTSCIE